MKWWTTSFKAIRVHDGELVSYGGPHVQAPSFELAQRWCNENRSYLVVIGELISEIPCHEGTYDPDFANEIDYTTQQNN